MKHFFLFYQWLLIEDSVLISTEAGYQEKRQGFTRHIRPVYNRPDDLALVDEICSLPANKRYRYLFPNYQPPMTRNDANLAKVPYVHTRIQEGEKEKENASNRYYVLESYGVSHNVPDDGSIEQYVNSYPFVYLVEPLERTTYRQDQMQLALFQNKKTHITRYSLMRINICAYRLDPVLLKRKEVIRIARTRFDFGNPAQFHVARVRVWYAGETKNATTIWGNTKEWLRPLFAFTSNKEQLKKKVWDDPTRTWFGKALEAWNPLNWARLETTKLKLQYGTVNADHDTLTYATYEAIQTAFRNATLLQRRGYPAALQSDCSMPLTFRTIYVVDAMTGKTNNVQFEVAFFISNEAKTHDDLKTKIDRVLKQTLQQFLVHPTEHLVATQWLDLDHVDYDPARHRSDVAEYHDPSLDPIALTNIPVAFEEQLRENNVYNALFRTLPASEPRHLGLINPLLLRDDELVHTSAIQPRQRTKGTKGKGARGNKGKGTKGKGTRGRIR